MCACADEEDALLNASERKREMLIQDHCHPSVFVYACVCVCVCVPAFVVNGKEGENEDGEEFLQ